MSSTGAGDSARLDFTQGILIGAQKHVALRNEVTRAFEGLRDGVFRYVFGITGNAADAEDITQDVFLRLFTERHKGKTIGDTRAWVYRVAHNLAMDRYRRDAGAPEVDARDWEQFQGAQIAGTDALTGLIAEERHRKFEATLSHLSLQERQCMELRMEGLRYREIAGVLGTRISSVQSYLVRAMQKILKEFHA